LGHNISYAVDFGTTACYFSARSRAAAGTDGSRKAFGEGSDIGFARGSAGSGTDGNRRTPEVARDHLLAGP
jgi:hypothetical protein